MSAKAFRLGALVFFCIFAISVAAEAQLSGTGWKKPRMSRPKLTFHPSGGKTAASSPGPMTADTMTRSVLPKLGTDSARRVAKIFGVTAVGGKKFSGGARADFDNIVSADGDRNENEPSIAINPRNEQIAVIFNHSYDDTEDDPCLATVSYDGGDTWAADHRVILPVLNVGDFCSDPVVRFSPDGEYAYFAYLSIAADGTTSQLVVQKAQGTDPSVLIGAPVSPFTLGSSVFIDKGWADVHTHDVAVGGTDSGVLYVTATAFDSSSDCSIVLNVSFDYGQTWFYPTGSPQTLDSSTGCSRVIQAARPIGGNNHFFMACWYDSGFDGFQAGKFFIDCIADDANATGEGMVGFSPYFFPGGARSFELPEFLGPNASYHRWWLAMAPSLAVDESGMVYLGFTQDPTSSQIDVEAGNVYVGQHVLNYTVTGAWPVAAVGTGPTAQGFVTLAARYDPVANKFNVYAAYYDHSSSNQFYKAVYRKGSRSPTGTTVAYGTKINISDLSSLSALEFIGDYFDSAVTGRRYQVVWTDRADVYSILDEDCDVLHDFFPR